MSEFIFRRHLLTTECCLRDRKSPEMWSQAPYLTVEKVGNASPDSDGDKPGSSIAVLSLNPLHFTHEARSVAKRACKMGGTVFRAGVLATLYL